MLLKSSSLSRHDDEEELTAEELKRGVEDVAKKGRRVTLAGYTTELLQGLPPLSPYN
jgi:hypothetical protein